MATTITMVAATANDSTLEHGSEYSETSTFTSNSTYAPCVGTNCTVTHDDAVSLDAELNMRFIYGAVGLIGMLGNALVIGVILSSKFMRRSTTNILIANQSGIDFSASMFIVLCTFIRDVRTVPGGFVGKEIFCRMWATNMPIWGLFVSSSYNLVCITLERFSGICYTMRHSRTCSRGRAGIVMAFAWFIGPAYNLAYMVPTSLYEDGQCSSFTRWPNLATQQGVGLFTIVLQFCIPLVIITVAYTRIARQLRKGVGAGMNSSSTDNPQDDRREQIMKRARLNVVKTLVTVAVSFVVCWSPNQIIYTMFNCGYKVDFGSTFYHFTVILAFANCCINPFIYSLQYDQFKNELFKRCRKRHTMDDSMITSVSTLHANSTMEQFDNVCFDVDS